VTSPMISVRGLSHVFGDRQVLHDVSFEVGAGEIFGFIGPNGAGKTTTIRAMATLLEPTSGTIEIDGIDVTAAPERVRARVGYMPDHAGVYERLSVREYLEFFADAYAVSRGGLDYGVVDAVLELTDLAKLDSRIVSTMSKGMKQRLQLARILLHDPKLLILDEPASDLDPRARIEMRDLLLELRGLGKTVFLSSHILTELADVCTSVAILERGRLVVSGPIGEISDRLAAARSPEARVTSGSAHARPRALRVKTLGASLDDVRRAISGLSEVTSVGAGSAGSVSIAHLGDDKTVAKIVATLVAAGVPVCGVEPERNELERIFLEVTQGDLQ
jgi:ABC-2 type transport system ATP-binding protein